MDGIRKTEYLLTSYFFECGSENRRILKILFHAHLFRSIYVCIYVHLFCVC